MEGDPQEVAKWGDTGDHSSILVRDYYVILGKMEMLRVIIMFWYLHTFTNCKQLQRRKCILQFCYGEISQLGSRGSDYFHLVSGGERKLL